MIFGIIILINLIIVFNIHLTTDFFEKIFIAVYIAIIEYDVIAVIKSFIKNWKESRKFININKEDENKFIYYRDIIKNISIAELGYFHNRSIKIETLISATIQSLLLKKNIEIQDNEIILLPDKKLLPVENYIIKSMKFWDLPQFKTELKKIIKKNLTELKYLQSAERIFSIKDTLVLMLTSICFFISIIIYASSQYIALYLILFFIYWLLMLIYIRVLSSYMSLITQKGAELYQKIKGMKNYLRDYSNFSEKELKELIIWREYMLYAIILDEGDKIEKQASQKYLELLDFLKNKYKLK